MADAQPTVGSLLESGYQARRDGRSGEAEALFNDAVRICRAANDALLPRALAGRANAVRDLGRRAEALAGYREAAEAYTNAGNRLGKAHSIRHVADVLRTEGSPGSLDASKSHYDASKSHYDASKSHYDASKSHYDASKSHYMEALAIYRKEPGAPPLDVANTLRGFGLLSEALGENDSALECWREAQRLYELADVPAGAEESARRIRRLAP